MCELLDKDFELLIYLASSLTLQFIAAACRTNLQRQLQHLRTMFRRTRPARATGPEELGTLPNEMLTRMPNTKVDW